MRLGGFPDRAAQVLSLLLYSPAQDGKHIKCFPLRAELAIKFICAARLPRLSGAPIPNVRSIAPHTNFFFQLKNAENSMLAC